MIKSNFISISNFKIKTWVYMGKTGTTYAKKACQPTESIDVSSSKTAHTKHNLVAV